MRRVDNRSFCKVRGIASLGDPRRSLVVSLQAGDWNEVFSDSILLV